MSEITLKQILYATNWYVQVTIKSEFGDVLVSPRTAKEMIEKLTDEQLEVKFDFMTVDEKSIIFGISRLNEYYFDE